jgi:hypothetical protein
MRKKLISSILLALSVGATSSLLFNIKSVQARPPYLASCSYDANGNVVGYECNYTPSPDGCSKSNC